MLQVLCLESAVDYITCTTKHEAETALMYHCGEKMQFREMEAGNIVEPWRSSGFSGFKVGQVVVASRGAEGLVQLSGATAGYDWFDIYQLADRVTRIDVQETYRLSTDVTKHVLRQYKRANEYNEQKHLGHKNSIWAGNDGGATAYFGSPKSERRMRIYNKAVESKLDHYAGCVRYELQLRDDSARVVAHRLADGSHTQATIRGCLQTFARGRALRVPSALACRTPISVPRPKPDVLRLLEWLGVQVAPSIKVVLRRGLSDQLVQHLNLSDEEIVSLVQSLKLQLTHRQENQKP